MKSEDALSQLRKRIQRLRLEAGEPSTRTISHKLLDHEISHDSVAKALRCRSLPSWGVLEPLVRGLGGDVEKFRRLWVDVRDQQEPLPLDPEDDDEDVGQRDTYDPVIRRWNTVEEADRAQDHLNERTREQEHEQDSLRAQLVSAREELADLTDQLAGLHGQLRQMRQQASLDVSLRKSLEAKIASLTAERDPPQPADQGAARKTSPIRRRQGRDYGAKAPARHSASRTQPRMGPFGRDAQTPPRDGPQPRT